MTRPHNFQEINLTNNSLIYLKLRPNDFQEINLTNNSLIYVKLTDKKLI